MRRKTKRAEQESMAKIIKIALLKAQITKLEKSLKWINFFGDTGE